MIQENWLQKQREKRCMWLEIFIFVYLHIPVVISKQMFVSKQTRMEHMTSGGHLHSPMNSARVSLQQSFSPLLLQGLEIRSWIASQAHHFS